VLPHINIIVGNRANETTMTTFSIASLENKFIFASVFFSDEGPGSFFIARHFLPEESLRVNSIRVSMVLEESADGSL